jgi:hypothetical protein
MTPFDRAFLPPPLAQSQEVLILYRVWQAAETRILISMLDIASGDEVSGLNSTASYSHESHCPFSCDLSKVEMVGWCQAKGVCAIASSTVVWCDVYDATGDEAAVADEGSLSRQTTTTGEPISLSRYTNLWSFQCIPFFGSEPWIYPAKAIL